ncbi:MAG: hypothetical protein KJ971_01595 [Firmicutes bacterium]|nr:hypothetical protein [Bacillota bacterium]
MANKTSNPKQYRLVLIKRYAFAAINLYGVIKLDDFISVCNNYENETLSKEEAIPLLELLSSIDEVDLSFRQNILANGYFFLEENRDFKEAKDLLMIQSNKPRYLPSKEEFLKYEDDDYVEPMKPLLDLEKFIIINKLVEIKKPEDIRYDVLEIHDQIILGNRMSDYMKYIRQRGYEFKDEIQVNLFAGLVMNLHNQTRMYDNNGFTPIELRELFEDNNEPVN